MDWLGIVLLVVGYLMVVNFVLPRLGFRPG